MRSRSACPAPLGEGVFFAVLADFSGAMVTRLPIVRIYRPTILPQERRGLEIRYLVMRRFAGAVHKAIRHGVSRFPTASGRGIAGARRFRRGECRAER